MSTEVEAVLQQYVRAVNNANSDSLREIWDSGVRAQDLFDEMYASLAHRSTRL